MQDFSFPDVVTIVVAMPEHGLTKGAIGTVVDTLTRPGKAYLVEFCDDDGRTVALLPLLPDQIKAYEPAPAGGRAVA